MPRKRPKPRARKRKLRFPVTDRHKWTSPHCIWCGKYAADPGEFLLLNAGAFSGDGLNGNSEPWYEAFLSVWWHGPHPLTRKPSREIQYISMANPQARLQIARKVYLGQFDIGFCSTRCFRRFWSLVADELEEKRGKEMARANAKGIYRYGVATRDRKSLLEPPKAKATRHR